MSELAFFRHGEELLRVALGETTRIGRSPECDVSLPDPALSRVQAVVERRGDAYHLVDRSGRGTQLDGADVAEETLSDGAELGLGTWRALFRAAPPPDEEATRVSGGTAVRSGPEAGSRPAKAGGRRSTWGPPTGPSSAAPGWGGPSSPWA